MHILAYGGVGPVVIRLRRTETELRGKELSQETLDAVTPTLLSEITPISDVRGSAESESIGAECFAKDAGGVGSRGKAQMGMENHRRPHENRRTSDHDSIVHSMPVLAQGAGRMLPWALARGERPAILPRRGARIAPFEVPR